MILLLLKKQLKAILEQTESADFEAKEILRWAVGEETFILPPDAEISALQSERAIEAAKKRAKGEPLQYILGEWDFFGLTFKVGEGVLIPRSETELLVEKALEILPPNADVIDLCSGSGCIPIAIAENSSARCWGVEISETALDYFKENITLNNKEDSVKAVQGDVLNPSAEILSLLPEKCSLITANPPYLTAEEMSNLQREVRHEPELALFGGEDGLDFYRSIFELWKGRLEEGGAFITEVGDNQAEAVKALMEKQGFCGCQIFEDYHRIGRVVMGRMAG